MILQVGNPNANTQHGITIGSNDEGARAFANDGDARAGSMTYTMSSDAMIFKTNGQNERMRLDNSGRLLAGTATATGKFIVQDSSLPKIQANFNDTAQLESGVGGSGGGFAITTGHFLTFNHQPYANRVTDTNLTERMRIDSSGNVLIGEIGSANHGSR